MSTTLKDNLSLLKDYSRSLYAKYHRYRSIPYIKVIESKKGFPIPVVKNIHVHSRYDPANEADQILRSYEGRFRNKKQICVIGWGFAYHVSRIFKYYRPQHVIVFEADPGMFFKSLEYISLKPFVDNKCRINLGTRLQPEYNPYEDKIFSDELPPGILVNTGSYNLFSRYYAGVIESINSIYAFYKADSIIMGSDGRNSIDSVRLKSILKDIGKDRISIYSLLGHLRNYDEPSFEELTIRYLRELRIKT